MKRKHVDPMLKMAKERIIEMYRNASHENAAYSRLLHLEAKGVRPFVSDTINAADYNPEHEAKITGEIFTPNCPSGGLVKVTWRDASGDVSVLVGYWEDYKHRIKAETRTDNPYRYLVDRLVNLLWNKQNPLPSTPACSMDCNDPTNVAYRASGHNEGCEANV